MTHVYWMRAGILVRGDYENPGTCPQLPERSWWGRSWSRLAQTIRVECVSRGVANLLSPLAPHPAQSDHPLMTGMARPLLPRRNPHKTMHAPNEEPTNRTGGVPREHRPERRLTMNVNEISPQQNSGGVVINPEPGWRVCRECSHGFRWEQAGPGRPPSFCSSACRFKHRRAYRARWMREWRAGTFATGDEVDMFPATVLSVADGNPGR